MFPKEVAAPDSGLDPSRKITVESRYVSKDYFTTMRIPLVAGAACDAHVDGSGVVVNRKFASTYFGTRSPVGLHLALSSGEIQPQAIVGVVGDARELGIDHEPVPTVYWCGPPIDPGRYYLVRTAGDPGDFAVSLRRAMQSVEPSRAVYDLAPLPSHLSDAFGEARLRTLLLTLFATTAISLACIGLYGSMSYLLATKRREIGLRMALGAPRRQVRLHFVAQGLVVAGVGIGIGLCLAVWSARFLSGMLYAVRSNDPAALGGAMAIMLSVALLASVVPAIRFTRTDPMQVLREQ